MRNDRNNRTGLDAMGRALGWHLSSMMAAGQISEDLAQKLQLAFNAQARINLTRAGLRFSAIATKEAPADAGGHGAFVAPTTWADSRRPIKRRY